MLLVIPAIELRAGRCVQQVQGVGGFSYSDDPVEMARLWRKENARSLHVTDLDGASTGTLPNAEAVKRIVDAVDIPVEVGGSLRTLDEVDRALSLGVYRVVVGTMVIEEPEVAQKALATFGASKIVLGVDAMDGMVMMQGWKESSGLTALSVALNAKAMGFRRMLYTEVRPDDTLRGINIKVLRDLAVNSGMRITSSGGLRGLEDLLAVCELESLGVDSVVIGRALYENRFSCQGLWRMCEAGDYPYTAKV
jgi:phosphoribosylformimino-5-aminoimidazole carboxamide ribotide isomerase